MIGFILPEMNVYLIHNTVMSTLNARLLNHPQGHMIFTLAISTYTCARVCMCVFLSPTTDEVAAYGCCIRARALPWHKTNYSCVPSHTNNPTNPSGRFLRARTLYAHALFLGIGLGLDSCP